MPEKYVCVFMGFYSKLQKMTLLRSLPTSALLSFLMVKFSKFNLGPGA